MCGASKLNVKLNRISSVFSTYRNWKKNYIFFFLIVVNNFLLSFKKITFLEFISFLILLAL